MVSIISNGGDFIRLVDSQVTPPEIAVLISLTVVGEQPVRLEEVLPVEQEGQRHVHEADSARHRLERLRRTVLQLPDEREGIEIPIAAMISAPRLNHSPFRAIELLVRLAKQFQSKELHDRSSLHDPAVHFGACDSEDGEPMAAAVSAAIRVVVSHFSIELQSDLEILRNELQDLYEVVVFKAIPPRYRPTVFQLNDLVDQPLIRWNLAGPHGHSDDLLRLRSTNGVHRSVVVIVSGIQPIRQRRTQRSIGRRSCAAAGQAEREGTERQ